MGIWLKVRCFLHVQIYLDIFNRNRSEKIETYKLNEKLVVENPDIGISIQSDNTYPYVLRIFKSRKEPNKNFHQLVANSNGAYFGKHDGMNFITLWEIATKTYINNLFLQKTWKYLGGYDLVGGAGVTEIPYPNYSDISEFLLSYGRKNNDQSYGGGTITILSSELKPACLPVYVPSGNDATLVGYVYIYNSKHDKKINIEAKGNNTLRVLMYYKR